MIADYVSFSPRNPLAGVFFGVVVAVSTWGLSALGVLQFPNGVLYDMTMRFGPSRHVTTDNIVVFTGPSEGDKTLVDPWSNALAILKELGARQIIFSGAPRNASTEFYREALRLGNVTFERVISDTDGELKVQPLPPNAQGLDLQYGAVGVPPASYGIHRRQNAIINVDGEQIPTLEWTAAYRFLGGGGSLPLDSFLINFQGPRNRIPVISLRRLLERGLIPELVRDRNVIISVDAPGLSLGLHTPITGSDALMPLPIFQGYALDTLVEHRWVTTASSLVTLIIVLTITGASLVIFQWVPVRIATGLTFASTAFFLASAWVLPGYTLYWPPVTEMLMAQVFSFLLVMRHKSLVQEITLRQLLTDTTAHLKGPKTPIFYATEDPWPQLMKLVRQVFDLDRVVLLERIQDQERVTPVQYWGCTVEDIHERRRDYRRVPYSTAIAENHTIPLTRSFLTRSSGEDQYLVPLSYGGELFGFWAFGIASERTRSISRFVTVVDLISVEMSQLLYDREQWRAHNVGGSGITRWFRLQGGHTPREPLRQAFDAMMRRVETLGWGLHGIDAAVAVFDLFGDTLDVNNSMLELLDNTDLNPLTLTALSLIGELTGEEQTKVKSILQHVVLGGKALSLTVAPTASKQQFLLTIHPIKQDENQQSGDTTSLELGGILVEVVDVTKLREPVELQEEALRRLMYQIRNDLESMVLAAGLLKDDQLPSEERSEVIDIYESKVRESITLVNDAQQHLGLDLDVGQLSRYPVHPLGSLNKALKSLTDKCKSRRVEFAIDAPAPEIVSMVLAEPYELEHALATVAVLLVEDAVSDSKIEIQLLERPGWVTYQFSNVGFGVPDDLFQSYVSGPDDATATEFQAIRESMRQIKEWEGRFVGSSDVGVGTRFTIELRSFLGMVPEIETPVAQLTA